MSSSVRQMDFVRSERIRNLCARYLVFCDEFDKLEKEREASTSSRRCELASNIFCCCESIRRELSDIVAWIHYYFSDEVSEEYRVRNHSRLLRFRKMKQYILDFCFLENIDPSDNFGGDA